MAHYEHNELISKSTVTRRAYLEGGQVDLSNWIGHEMLRLDSYFKTLVEVYQP